MSKSPQEQLHQQHQQFFLASVQTPKQRADRMNAQPTQDEQGLFYKGTVGTLQAQKRRLNKQLSQQRMKNAAIQEEYMNRINKLTLEQQELNRRLAAGIQSAQGKQSELTQLRITKEKLFSINNKLFLEFQSQINRQAEHIKTLTDTVLTMRENANLLKQDYAIKLNRLNHAIEQSMRTKVQQEHKNQVKGKKLEVHVADNELKHAARFREGQKPYQPWKSQLSIRRRNGGLSSEGQEPYQQWKSPSSIRRRNGEFSIQESKPEGLSSLPFRRRYKTQISGSSGPPKNWNKILEQAKQSNRRRDVLRTKGSREPPRKIKKKINV